MRRIFVIFLFHLLVKANCCCDKNDNATPDDAAQTKSFNNLTGILLESAVIGEISQQTKSSQRIQLKGLRISTINKNMMKNFSGLFSIDLSNNLISEIENETFAENSKLEKIDLMFNRLTKISKRTFHGDFNELEEINLSHNLLTLIEPGAFDKVPSLESIDLSCNCLKHIHSDVFKKNPNLRHVYLQSNDITKISNDLFNSKTDLMVLDLSKNKLDFVPELSLTQVKRFDLSFNEINLLDLNYAHEKKKSAVITELKITNNQISECSELDERRTDILHLDLSNNLIADLDDFPSFLNLEVLILANNSITDLSLHNFEDRFPSLKVLNIRANPVACGDYKYIRNNLQSIVFTSDSAIMDRCHANSSTTKLEDYDDYENDVVIREIRGKNRIIMEHLELNQMILLIMLSLFVVYVMVSLFFVLRSNFNLKSKKKGNLLDHMEM